MSPLIKRKEEKGRHARVDAAMAQKWAASFRKKKGSRSIREEGTNSTEEIK